jgi:excisionase family DNA binding protein
MSDSAHSSAAPAGATAEAAGSPDSRSEQEERSVEDSMTDQAAVAQMPSDRGRLLTPGEVAQVFRVDPKTASRWAATGLLPSIRTPGGHRRFFEADVRALLNGEGDKASERASA